MNEDMYEPGVYAQRAIEWLAKAQVKSSIDKHEAAATYVEGAKVYAMLAETACRNEEKR